MNVFEKLNILECCVVFVSWWNLTGQAQLVWSVVLPTSQSGQLHCLLPSIVVNVRPQSISRGVSPSPLYAITLRPRIVWFDDLTRSFWRFYYKKWLISGLSISVIPSLRAKVTKLWAFLNNWMFCKFAWTGASGIGCCMLMSQSMAKLKYIPEAST